MKALQVVALALLLLAIGFVGGTLHGEEAWSYALSLRSQDAPQTSNEDCTDPARDAAGPLAPYWVTYGDGAWRVRIERFGVPLRKFDSQEDAEAFALQLAQMTCPAQITFQQREGRRITRIVKILPPA